jgi:conjugative relaxase-like TrwC/TraI family protein
VLIVTPVSPAAAAYYFRDQGSGRWVGGGTEALGLSGAVERRALVAVLQGCDPGDGHFLPARKPTRRRAGWDLTLAAPKSVSLLGAGAGEAADLVAASHRAAVDGVVADFESRLLRLRRSGVPGGLAPSDGMVAAAFEHRANASGEPHLHTHLLLVNLGRDRDGMWSAVDSGWWTVRRGISAIYQLGLRHHLGAAGGDLAWRIREDGLADLVDVPRAAVRAASGRSRTAAAERAAFLDPGGGRRWGIRAGATIGTRRSASPQVGEAATFAAGFGPDQAAQVIRSARARDTDRRAPSASHFPEPDLVKAVTGWLASQRSSFRQSDVLVALAGCAPGGMPRAAAVEWAERFCEAAIPVAVATAAAPRWTTEVARAADLLLIDRASNGRPAGGPEPSCRAPESGLVATALARHPSLSPEGNAAARELLQRAGGIRILHAPPGRANLLAQAAVLEAASTAWQAAGLGVAVATSAEHGEARWRALTGIEPFQPGARPDIIIVDHADRRSSPELLAVLAQIDRSGAEAVLLEGGTSPRLGWMHSDALTWLGDRPGRLGRLDPGPTPLWAEVVASAGGLDAPVRGVHAYPTAADAVHHLLAGWADGWSPDARAVLVGLGYAEVDGLNQAARAVLARRGEIAGPGLSCRGRVIQAGDRMLTLRRAAPDLPGGTAVDVAEVDPDRARVTVRWGRRNAVLDRGDSAHLGYAYAVTPAWAARTPGRFMVLGPPDAVGPHRGRVAMAAVVAPVREVGRQRDRPAPAVAPRWPERDRGPGIGLG